MTVGELIKALATENPDRVVIMARDAEGNGYSPLDEWYSTGAYEATCAWAGKVGLEALTAAAANAGFTEDDVIDGVPALILWPTN